MIRTRYFMLIGVAALLFPLISHAVGQRPSFIEGRAIMAPSDAVLADSGGPTPALPRVKRALFATSGYCVLCHTNETIDGTTASYAQLWRSTMLASSFRDLYWRATVRSEVEKVPHLAAVIEEKCATCHAPMARTTLHAAGRSTPLLDSGLFNPAHSLHDLARDGVSCLVCHQVRPDGLGDPATASGGFRIDTTMSAPRTIYGPNESTATGATMMERVTGYRPARGAHLRDPELCASCHTLFTPFLDSSGAVAGLFPEQMAYHEWQAGDFSPETTCQSCHMKEAPPAREGAPVRHRHDFVGANVTMLRLLAAVDQAAGNSVAFWNQQIARTVRYLQEEAAGIEITDVREESGRLRASVIVTNRTGHKLPSGFPSRRVWVKFTVINENGDILFRSGAFQATGEIRGNDNDESAERYEPHHRVIRSEEDVAIYEAVLKTTEGAVTTTLMRGSGYLKDNRLPPSGFDKAAAAPEIAVHGAAADDPDFAGGRDVVEYDVAVPRHVGRLRVRAELLFQSIGYRWAENLDQPGNREAETFLRLLRADGNRPVRLAVAERAF